MSFLCRFQVKKGLPRITTAGAADARGFIDWAATRALRLDARRCLAGGRLALTPAARMPACFRLEVLGFGGRPGIGPDQVKLVAIGADLDGGDAALLQRPDRRAVEEAERPVAEVPVAGGAELSFADVVASAAGVGGHPRGSIVVVAAQRLADEVGTHGVLAHPAGLGCGRRQLRQQRTGQEVQERASQLQTSCMLRAPAQKVDARSLDAWPRLAGGRFLPAPAA